METVVLEEATCYDNNYLTACKKVDECDNNETKKL